MHILLPPSEGKNPGGSGASLAETGFAADAIGRHRRRLTAAVASGAGRTRRTAMAAFVLPEAVADAAIAANSAIVSSPTTAALDRYAGVVYAGLEVATMSPAERAIAEDKILVFSGLFGVLGAAEPVPDYRVPAAAKLARIGLVGSSWRPILARSMPGLLGDIAGGLVLDLRSTDYAAMWRAPSDRPALSVRIMTEMPDERLMVVSYVSKLAKGRLARALVEREADGERIETAEDVARVWAEAGLGRQAPNAGAANGRLELITTPAG